MKLMRWYLVLSALLSVQSIASDLTELTKPQRAIPCAVTVLRQVLGLGHILRQETLEASERYQRRFFADYFAVQSNLSSSPQFNPEILASWEWEFLSSAGEHVVSLGSGPDIFRPLYNFPLAKHIHLIDVLEGWHPNPNVALLELVRRLENIGPNAHVELIDGGFADANLGHPPRPCRWKVSWDSDFSGRQTRYVSLHREDYRDIEAVQTVLSHIEAEKIAALFITMARFPEGEALSLFLDKLKVGGVFHADMDYLNLEGNTSTPADPSVRAHMEAQGMKATHVLPRPTELVEQGPEYFWPNFYRFQKERDRP